MLLPLVVQAQPRILSGARQSQTPRRPVPVGKRPVGVAPEGGGHAVVPVAAPDRRTDRTRPYGLVDNDSGARGPMWSSETIRWLPTLDRGTSLVRPYVNAAECEQVRRRGWHA